jgi:hypothetical protein
LSNRRFDFEAVDVARFGGDEHELGLHLLNLEYERVVRPSMAQLPGEARRIAGAIVRGDLEMLAAECTRYSPGPDRLAYTRETLAEELAMMKQVAALVDKPPMIELRPPSPQTGMVAQADVMFGAVQKPRGKRENMTWHARHGIELWWSGQVMPEANGPRFTSPGRDRPPPGRWRFYRCFAPRWEPNVYLE